MTPRVLMSNAGELFLGWRVCILDDEDRQLLGVYVALSHDGWVFEFPADVSPYKIYFNRESEKWFEDLGEL